MGVTLIVSALSPGRTMLISYESVTHPCPSLPQRCLHCLPHTPAPSSLACPRLSLTGESCPWDKGPEGKESPPQHCPSTAHCVSVIHRSCGCVFLEKAIFQVLPGKVPAFLLGGEEAGNRSAGPALWREGSASWSAFWRVSSSKEEQVVLLEQGKREPR